MLCCTNGGVSSAHERINSGIDKRCCQFGKLFGAGCKPSCIHGEVLTLKKTQPTQFIEKSNIIHCHTWAPAYDTNMIGPTRFLRPHKRRQESTCTACYQRDELAPS
jgi:hypothetical protein